MRMIDLFAGIGVASLAAETVFPGIEHEFVEINPFSQTILKKHFPNAPIYPDIRTYHPTGAVDIVWGSPPCQAASQAGKRKGTADSRWLWGDYFRVIGEAKPKWTIAENVSGLLSLDNGLAFEDLCRGLENLGYTVRTYIIPALAVGAPHRRDRLWLVGYSNSNRQSGAEEVNTTEARKSPLDDTEGRYSDDELEIEECPDEHGRYHVGSGYDICTTREGVESIIADSINDSDRGWGGQIRETEGLQGERGEALDTRLFGRADWQEDWRSVAFRTCVRGVYDGPTRGLYRLANGKTITAAGLRTERLKALGNSLVYPLVVKLFEAIKYAEDNQGGNTTI